MEIILNFAISALTLFLMFTVGLELHIDDFRRLLNSPKKLVIPIVVQWLLIPGIIALILTIARIEENIKIGFVILSASPAGGISNFYTWLAKADVALSVSLTTLSTITSILIFPIIISIGNYLMYSDTTNSSLSFTSVLTSVLFFLVLPIILGMKFKLFFPNLSITIARHIRLYGAICLSFLLIAILIDHKEDMQVVIEGAWLGILSFTGLAMFTGLMVAIYLKATSSEKFAIMVEFASRNMAITAMAGITIFNDPIITVFATLVFLLQTPIFLLTCLIYSISKKT